jgi:hypothetical protein
MLPLTYFIWHYTAGFLAGLQVAGRINLFIVQFFSLPLLFKTLFSPWRRLAENYASGLEPEKWLETLVVNLLMRVVGAIIRSAMIMVGVLGSLLTLGLTLLALALWLLLPAVVVGLIVVGLMLIFF